MELLLDCLVSALFIGIYLNDARKAVPAPAPIAPPVTEKSILAGVTQYMAQAVTEFTTLSVDPDDWKAEPGHHPLVVTEWDLESDIPTDGPTMEPIEPTTVTPTDGPTIEPIEPLTVTPTDDTAIEPIDDQPVIPLERMTLKQLVPIAKRYKVRTSNVRKPALLAAIKAAMAE